MLDLKIKTKDFINLVNSGKITLNKNKLEKKLSEIKIVPIQNDLNFTIPKDIIQEEVKRIFFKNSISLELI
jgi:hypothetical protein